MNQWIESASKLIIKWQFKINQIRIWSTSGYNKFTEFYFGITSKEVDKEKDFGSGEHLSYCVDNWSRKYCRNAPRGHAESSQMQNDDLVTFTLDLVLKLCLVSVNHGVNKSRI